MALIAGVLKMRAVETELRLSVMVEFDVVERRRRVAPGALLAELFIMKIVVAALAIPLDRFVPSLGVTLLAGHPLMFSDERERRIPVVVENQSVKRLFGVTGHARFRELPPVNIEVAA
jgi:hypothetical protein